MCAAAIYKMKETLLPDHSLQQKSFHKIMPAVNVFYAYLMNIRPPLCRHPKAFGITAGQRHFGCDISCPSRFRVVTYVV